MKILYGVNAFGNGHITRSRVMAKELKKAGHDVTFLFSGREQDKFFDMEDFGDKIIYKKGLQFYIKNGKVDIFKSITNNDISQVLKDIDNINCADYDLIISDFEPITAWAAKLQNKTSIGIGHQYAFTKKIPVSHTNKFVLWLMNHYAPVKIGLGLHWHHFNENILPPIIDVEHFEKNNIIIDNKILVYLPFENQDNLVELFSKFTNYDFFVYNKDYQKVIDNTSFRTFNKDGFLFDLQTSSAVICNAGFELASEAIHLNKKLLVKPVFGQMEQHSNALAIEQLNYGYSTDNITSQVIKDWLTNNSLNNLPNWPNVAKQIVFWLNDINKPFDFTKIWESINEKTL